MPGRKPPSNSGKTLLAIFSIIGGAILLTGIVFAILLFSSRSCSRSGGEDSDSADQQSSPIEMVTLDEIQREKPEESPEPTKSVTVNSYLSPGDYYASGYLGDLPCTLDFSVDNSGSIQGTFWNLFYDIKLGVTGSIDSSGNMTLNLGSGNTLSQMTLSSQNHSANFIGSWGKDHKPVNLKIGRGARDLTLPSGSGTAFKIEGGGMTTRGHITSDGGNSYIMTYDNQPAVNAMKCSLQGNTFYIHNPFDGKTLAQFRLPGNSIYDSGSATLYIINGKEFTITLL